MNIILKRFLWLLNARNKEFFRDRASFGWNFLFPFLILIGFSAMFQRGGHEEYKVGLVPPQQQTRSSAMSETSGLLKQVKLFRTIEFSSRDDGLDRLRLHKVDMVVELGSEPIRYWINDASPKGTICESLLLKAAGDPGSHRKTAVRQTVSGDRIDYIDWLFPGVIAMNMMFSALYGAGYVIVRYRKMGVLKRLQATPVGAFEYLSAQAISRLLVIIFSGVILFAGCSLLLGFECRGSYLDLLIVYTIGGAAIISLGLVISARTSSEELANGVLNMISWPMMFLSEVWFSIEGSSEWVQKISQTLPLTHVTEGMRQIMNEGAGLNDVRGHIAYLAVMFVLFLAIGSRTFRWSRE